MSTAVVESKLEERIAQDLAPFDAIAVMNGTLGDMK
jgi:hypothetical protein